MLLRDPAGGFVKAKDSPYPVAKAGAVAVADFNGDDRMDVVASRYDGLTGNTVVVLLQKVDGSFGAEANPAATGVAPRYISVADFNVDGRPDLAVSKPRQRLGHDPAAEGKWRGVRPGGRVAAQGRGRSDRARGYRHHR